MVFLEINDGITLPFKMEDHDLWSVVCGRIVTHEQCSLTTGNI